MMPPQPQWFGERDKGASPFRAANFPKNKLKKMQLMVASNPKTK